MNHEQGDRGDFRLYLRGDIAPPSLLVEGRSKKVKGIHCFTFYCFF